MVTEDGFVVGSSVGDTEGRSGDVSLGFNVSSDVGENDGCSNSKVGEEDGSFRVGVCVGVHVGSGVGEVVGDQLGFSVGGAAGAIPRTLKAITKPEIEIS